MKSVRVFEDKLKNLDGKHLRELVGESEELKVHRQLIRTPSIVGFLGSCGIPNIHIDDIVRTIGNVAKMRL